MTYRDDTFSNFQLLVQTFLVDRHVINTLAPFYLCYFWLLLCRIRLGLDGNFRVDLLKHRCQSSHEVIKL